MSLVQRLKCDLCEKTFCFVRTLEKHMLKHGFIQNNEKKCEICGKQFDSISNLNKHMKNMHKENPIYEKPSSLIFQCDICEKNFKSSIYLRKHINDITYIQ